MPEKILEIRDLAVSFATPAGELKAVRGVDLSVEAGEILCLVGESGCGKTVTCHAVMHLLPGNGRIKAGQIKLCGEDITHYSERQMRSLRGGSLAMVFQDPLGTLNPTMSVGEQIVEVIRKHQRVSKKEARARAIAMLKLVGITEAEQRFKLQPHFFSGGMRQRCVLAVALAAGPRLLLADEATTALDVTVKARILDLLLEIRQKTNIALVFVTHDLGSAARIADKVAVMYKGQIVETGTAEEIFYNARHPYTQKLLAARPQAAGPQKCQAAQEALLELRHVSQHFFINKELTVKAVDGLDLTLYRGEIFGLVGESGCGKSTVSRMIASIYQPTAGEIFLQGESLKDNKSLRRKVQLIFQDAAAALNPRMTVAEIILEPLRIQGEDYKSAAVWQKITALLDQVALSETVLKKLPGELSGGQRQRVAIVRSLLVEPDVLVADEPIASLDISTQGQIIALLKKLQREKGFSLLFIAHDLAVVRNISDRVGVMLQGKMVEMAAAEELFSHPQHPYTKALLSAIPVPDPQRERAKKILSYDTGSPVGEKIVYSGAGHYVLV